MIKMNKVALMVALLLPATCVEAKPLGSSSSRPSTSASVGVSRSPPQSRPSYTPQQSRLTYVPAVQPKQPAYTPSLSVDCNQSYNYNAPECYNRQNDNSSNTGSMIAAGVAGLAGAALGAGAMAIANSGFSSLFEMLAVLGLLGIVGYAIYKYKTSKR